MTNPESLALRRGIAGTLLFDGELASRGFALNAMCFSFNDAANREAFRADEDAYCRRYRLTPEQHDAVARRDVPAMIEVGGNVYYLAKLLGIFGLDVQDLGALQTGMSVGEFRAYLLEQAGQVRPVQGASLGTGAMKGALPGVMPGAMTGLVA